VRSLIVCVSADEESAGVAAVIEHLDASTSLVAFDDLAERAQRWVGRHEPRSIAELRLTQCGSPQKGRARARAALAWSGPPRLDDMSKAIEIEPVAGWRGRALHGEQMTVVSYEISVDAPDVHEHNHAEEEAWTVIEGRLLVSIEGREQELGPGEFVIVDANARHWVRALQRSRAVVVDSPARRDLPGNAH
jgi:quercetin dioxygenase-like cupin family protein